VSEPLLTQNHQNKATADSVKSVFFENTIEPRIKLITESITQYLQKNGLDANIKLAYEDSNFYDETLWNQKLEFAFMNNIISPQTYLSLADFPSNLSEEYDKELSKITAISTNGITENSISSPTTDEQQNTEQI
jgi:phenylacetate-coenzyme A ligase PaaK-like adenylate-forming protein